MTCSISVFGAILVVTAVTPAIVLAIALLSIVYYRVQVSTRYLPCSSSMYPAAVSAETQRFAGGGPERPKHRVGGWHGERSGGEVGKQGLSKQM